MTLRRTILLCVSLIGLLVVMISAFSERGSRPPERGSATAAAASDPVVALQREVGLLKQLVMRPRVMSVPSTPTQDSNATGESRDLDMAPQPVKAIEPGQVVAMLEAHFAGESADRAWSDTLRRELSHVLDVSQTRTTVSAVECATSLCKVTLIHENLEAQRELGPTIASLPVLSAGVFYSYLDNEKPPRTVLYVMREGHDISEMLAAQ